MTAVVIPDVIVPQLVEEKHDSDESDEDDEEPEAVEEVKTVVKAPVKLLSKKEQKKLEDEEFERVLKEMNVEKTETV